MVESVDEILAVLDNAGPGHYGESAVTQLEHALQCATLAERDGAPPALIAAALLHDIGHLVNPDDRRDTSRGEDGEHEQTGAEYLARWFGEEVTRPVYLHVAAKRYLTATNPASAGILSPASALSLRLQGGPFSSEAATRFAVQPGAEAAIRLRRWDEAAKQPKAVTPPLDHFRRYLANSRR
jgi:phosphonate degradation associated HDIG domain protein